MVEFGRVSARVERQMTSGAGSRSDGHGHGASSARKLRRRRRVAFRVIVERRDSRDGRRIATRRRHFRRGRIRKEDDFALLDVLINVFESVDENDQESEIVPPTPENLAILLDLTRKGLIKNLLQELDRLLPLPGPALDHGELEIGMGHVGLSLDGDGVMPLRPRDVPPPVVEIS